MAIRKQNRALLIFIAVILVVLGFSLMRENKLTSKEKVSPSNPRTDGSTSLSNSGTSATTSVETSADDGKVSEKQKAFAQIVGDLADCFGYKIAEPNSSAPVTLDTVVMNFQTELGPVAHQNDRWVDWHIRNEDGQEKRLRLEISENDDGTIRKELHTYVMGRNGQPVTVEMDPSQAVNPSDQTLNELLREGEVFMKEQAGSVFFSGGEHLDYVQKNGDLSEIEFVKGEKFFQCQDLSRREQCQCMK